jgi:hypothetical protein
LNWLFVKPKIAKKHKQLTIEETIVRARLEKRKMI